MILRLYSHFQLKAPFSRKKFFTHRMGSNLYQIPFGGYKKMPAQFKMVSQEPITFYFVKAYV